MNSTFLSFFVLVILACAGLTNAFPLHPKFYHADAEKFVPGEYIVVLNEDSTLEHLVDLAERYEARVRYEIGDTFKGFAAKLSDETLALLLEEPHVSFIEPDQIMSANICPDRQGGVCWGQDRVTASGPNNLDDKLHYKTSDGTGVNVYVIDTGILVTHNDFSPGRAIWGYNAVAGSSNTDKNGHGTHVASTAVGNTWGFAKKATVYAVKVLGDDGSGSNSGVIDGVNWVANQKKATGKPTVGNMSLGGGLSTALNNAVNAAVNVGVIMAVAAGNDNKDACLYSPASATAAITVGATQQAVTGSQQIDARSSFSNWGSCLDIFAPGSLITAAWIGSNSALKTISGTSMASPHVAGIAAVLLGENNSLSPASMKQLLNNDSQVNLISMGCASTCGASPNRLLHRKSC